MTTLTMLLLLLTEPARVAEVTHGRVVPEHTIQVTNTPPFYAPATVTIRAGETVHWRSGKYSETHSVREALHGTFALEIAPGGEVSHQFRRPGEYQYRCRYHPWMTGRIVVEPKRLAIRWQSFPETLRNGRLVAGEGFVFLTGGGARPEIARLDRGNVVPLGRVGHRVRADVEPVAGPDGSLWFSGETPGTLVQFSTHHGTSTIHDAATASLTAIAAAPDGSVWVHDGRRIARFTPKEGTEQSLDANVPIQSVRVTANGTVWLVDQSGRVGRLDRAEIVWTALEASAQLTVSHDAAWLLSGNRGKILRLDRTGEVIEFTVPPVIGNRAMLVPTEGGVWITSRDGRIAQLVDGQFEEYVTSPPARAVGDAVTGSNDELWLLDGEEHRIGHVAVEVRSLARLQ